MASSSGSRISILAASHSPRDGVKDSTGFRTGVVIYYTGTRVADSVLSTKVRPVRFGSVNASVGYLTDRN